mgnify:CR=1 FL=1
MNAIITNIARAQALATTPEAPERSVHLIDVENLCGESNPTKHRVEIARKRYLEAVWSDKTDHFIVASSRGNFMNASLGWPGARYLVRDGKDGADFCLAEVMSSEKLEQRFRRAVVASGDGGLAPCVAQLAGSGLHTVVVSSRNRLSRLMRLASHKCIVLTPELEEIA